MAFVKGKSGNPLGRPIGARQKIVEPFLESLHKRWTEKGDAILDRLEINDPAQILRAMTAVMPKEVGVSIEQRNSLGVDPRLWSGFQRVLLAIEECAPPDANPVDVFEAMERWIRAEFARPIEASADVPSALSVEKAE